VVRAVAVHAETSQQLAGGGVDADDVGEAGAGDDEDPAVRGGVHVVDELVVAFADQVADAEEVGVVDGVALDLRQALVESGMTLRVPRWSRPASGVTTLTVPSQLFPTNSTSRTSGVSCAAVAEVPRPIAASAARVAASAARWWFLVLCMTSLLAGNRGRVKG
jgi:hypothetical protein